MKKRFKFIKTLLNWVLGLMIVFTISMSFLAVMSLDKDNKKSLFGYNTYIVLSDSMKDTFAAGDIIVTKVVDVNTLVEEDIITFRSTSEESFGKITTHKIRSINRNAQGAAISFVTYGTTTGADDSSPALVNNVFGKYQFKIAKMGYFFEFLKKPIGYISLIFLPIGIMLVFQGINTLQLYKKYRLEKSEEAAAALAKENEAAEELRRLKEELEALKKDHK